MLLEKIKELLAGLVEQPPVESEESEPSQEEIEAQEAPAEPPSETAAAEIMRIKLFFAFGKIRTPNELIECIPVEGCDRVTPEAANLPRFLSINFKDKKIVAPSGSEAGRTTAIERLEHIDGKLIIEGAEDGAEGVRDGLGWSMAINEESGDMVLTASGDRVGFVIFGACTPKE